MVFRSLEHQVEHHVELQDNGNPVH